MSNEKKRIDVLLVDKGLATTREKAKRIVMSGVVFVDNERVDKAGTKVSIDKKIEIRGNTNKYVSRGGYKLERALETFPINLKDTVCIDIGSSTGGFTDCMLQNGAKKVFAIDVGRGQLDWGLRNDDRVISMEKTNIRYVTLEQVGEMADFISVDVSFISLKLVLPVVKKLLKKGGKSVVLIKPQFEAGKDKVGKNGVVKDLKVHYEVSKKVVNIINELEFNFLGFTHSPIKGPKGNIEYLLFFENDNFDSFLDDEKINEIIEDGVELSHENLK